jgi:hypothetical protein
MAPSRDDELELFGTRLLGNDFAKSWHFYRDRLGLTPAKGHGHPPYGEFVRGKRALFGIFDRARMARAVGLRAGRYPSRNVGRPP